MQHGDADYEIVIVGLGPVGAVAANLAGAAGFRTLVIERSDQPYLKPRAIVFDAEIMRIFAAIGLAAPITEATRPLGGSIYLGADRQPIRTFRAPPPANDLAWHPSNLFFQPQLETILRDGIGRFNNVTILHERELTGIRQRPSGGVTVDVSHVGGSAMRVESNFVLACDGASSTVRKALGIGLDDIGFEERWLVVDTFVDGPMRWPATHGIPEEVRDGRYSLMVCDPRRPATLIPGVGRHRRWEYMLFPEEHPDDDISDDWLRDQLALWIDPADVEIIRSAVYRFRALIARRWRQGSVLLIGDAAHQTPPFYGQGMCHGIRDAAQLMWKLRLVRDGIASTKILDSHQIEREPHVREIVSASVAAGAAVCKTDPAEAAKRDAEFRAIEGERNKRPVAMTDIVPPIRAGLIDVATGGMRLPEFALAAPDGGRTKVDDLLDGRFAVLGIEPADPGFDPAWCARLGLHAISASAGADSALAAWLTERGARWALVRPDRYIHSLCANRSALDASLALLHDQLGSDAGLTRVSEPTEMTLS